MTLLEMSQALHIEKLPDCFDVYFQEVQHSYHDRGQQILSESYIRTVLAESGAMLPYQELILAAAAELRPQPAALLLICLLEKWVRSSDAIDYSTYTPPQGNSLGCDFLHLFAALPTIPDSVAHLKQRNVPEDVILATMQEYDFCVDLCKLLSGRPAFDCGRLSWMRWLIHNKLLRIGCLKFDFFRQRKPREALAYQDKQGKYLLLANNVRAHRTGGVLGSAGLEDPEGSFRAVIEETDRQITGYPVINGCISPEKVVLDRAQWQLALSAEDPVICIHIPYGTKLDPAFVADSYARARRILAECYPDLHYKAFYTHTWLLSPQLQAHLKPASHILSFQHDFMLFPCRSGGQFVFPFLFALAKAPEDLSSLPENTSLQRSVKSLYLSGGFIHECCGIFF